MCVFRQPERLPYNCARVVDAFSQTRRHSAVATACERRSERDEEIFVAEIELHGFAD